VAGVERTIEIAYAVVVALAITVDVEDVEAAREGDQAMSDLVAQLRHEASEAEKSRHTRWIDPDFLTKAADEIERLNEALKDAVAHLAGAASAYEKYAKRGRNRRVANGMVDPFFLTRSRDFRCAAERGRRALAGPSVEES
jgi:post-segregation antitoxin (ccd killing protein)